MWAKWGQWRKGKKEEKEPVNAAEEGGEEHAAPHPEAEAGDPTAQGGADADAEDVENPERVAGVVVEEHAGAAHQPAAGGEPGPVMDPSTPSSGHVLAGTQPPRHGDAETQPVPTVAPAESTRQGSNQQAREEQAREEQAREEQARQQRMAAQFLPVRRAAPPLEPGVGAVSLSAREARVPKWLACGHSSAEDASRARHICVDAERLLLLDGLVQWHGVQTLQIRAESVVFGPYLEGLEDVECLYISAKSVDMTRLFAAKHAGWALPSLLLLRFERVDHMFLCEVNRRCGHPHFFLPRLAVLELPGVSEQAQEALCFALEGASAENDGLSALPSIPHPTGRSSSRDAAPHPAVASLTHPNTSLAIPHVGRAAADAAASRLGPLPAPLPGAPHVQSHLAPLPVGPEVEATELLR